VSYIGQRPLRPKPTPHAAFCKARQMMVLEFIRWLAEGPPSREDVALEIDATPAILHQLFELHLTHSKASI
jgi:hypothetical protein